MSFIDTHCHLAWGIDDGFQEMEDSEAALRVMEKDGITSVIATPHFVPGQLDNDIIREMDERINDLRMLARPYNVKVYEGCELFLNHEYLDVLENGQYHTLANSKYLLCEFDVRKNIKNNDEVEDILYEITVKGLIPVIAHVERYFHDGIDIDRVQGWVDMGCKVQINRTSILGMHGSTIQKNAHKLIRSNMAHIIASDAHRPSGNRICLLSDVYQYVKDSYGEENADILMKRNPRHIIEDEELEEIQIEQKKSIFRKLWRR